MYSNKNIVALIPARAGSKRLVNKNIKDLDGQPLISYSINEAKKSKWIDRIVVSADSQEIVEIAARYGAETPFIRPENISVDKTSDYPVIAHAIKWLKEQENYSLDYVVYLRPTVPIRPEGLIDQCIERIIESGADSVRSVREVGRYHPYWMLKLDAEGYAEPFLEGKTIDRYYQHQLLPKLYEHDGYCDIVNVRNIDLDCLPTQTLQGMYGKKMITVINEDELPLINIDREDEFQLAEFLMRKVRRAHAPSQ